MLQVGKIIELNYRSGTGSVSDLSTHFGHNKIPFTFLDYKSNNRPEPFRLVVFDIIDSKAINLYDFTPELHSNLIPEVLRGQGVLINHNPQCLEFFIEHNLGGNYLTYDMSKIAKTLKQREYFSIEYQLRGYKVEWRERHTWKPGDDDSASIAIDTRVNYEPFDSYMHNLLPKRNEVVTSSRGFQYWKTMMDELWLELGGKDHAQQELTERCQKLTLELAEKAKMHYNGDKHREELQALYNSKLWELKRRVYSSS